MSGMRNRYVRALTWERIVLAREQSRNKGCREFSEASRKELTPKPGHTGKFVGPMESAWEIRPLQVAGISMPDIALRFVVQTALKRVLESDQGNGVQVGPGQFCWTVSPAWLVPVCPLGWRHAGRVYWNAWTRNQKALTEESPRLGPARENGKTPYGRFVT